MIIRVALAVACGLIPLLANNDAAVSILAVLAIALLAQARVATLTSLGGAAVVAELVLAIQHGHSGTDLLVGAADGLSLVALSGCTHHTQQVQDPLPDLLAAAPAVLVAIAAGLVVPSLGGLGFLTGCVAGAVIIAVAAYRSTAARGPAASHGSSEGENGRDV